MFHSSITSLKDLISTHEMEVNFLLYNFFPELYVKLLNLMHTRKGYEKELICRSLVCNFLLRHQILHTEFLPSNKFNEFEGIQNLTWEIKNLSSLTMNQTILIQQMSLNCEKSQSPWNLKAKPILIDHDSALLRLTKH
jgi:hypothetical protein